MFRIGLKREEKEILTHTITELRELRAELSGLKDTLARITAGDQAGDHDGQAPAKEAGSETECACQSMETGVGTGEGDSCEAGTQPAAPDRDVSAIPDRPAASGRDWAVVSFAGARRPWWKFWEPAGRVTKRSI